MDITLSSAELTAELTRLTRVISQKPVIPILANVFMQADASGSLRLATTNLEVALVTSCRAQVDIPGTVTLPVDKLLGITKLLEGDVRLTLEDPHVRLRADTYNARLPTMPASDFPQLPTMRGLTHCALPRTALLDCLTKTRPAVATKSTNLSLNGTLLVAADGVMTLVATDSHRLAVTRAASRGTVAQVIVPVTALDELTGLIAEGGEAVTFAQSDRHLFFALDGRLLVSRVLAGKYPAYERIIPKARSSVATIDAARLRLALQRVCLLAGELQSVDMEIDGAQLRVATNSAQYGDAGEQLAITYTGQPFSTCVSGPYVLDFLGALDGPIELHVGGPNEPLLFTQGADYVYVLMPIKAK